MIFFLSLKGIIEDKGFEMYQTLLINIDELLLKGNNQSFFLKKLNDHIRSVLKTHHQHDFQYFKDSKRQVAESSKPFSPETIAALLKIPGLHSMYLGRRIPLNFDDILPAVIEDLKTYSELPATFRVQTKRSLKSFPKDSMTISGEIGHKVGQLYPQMKVNLKKPQLVIDIKVLDRGIYLSTRRPMGIGGLPVGSTGHLICLLSGGFDSPVASYLMSKRGCEQSYVFFHAYPFVGDEVKKKILDLVKVLSQYQFHPKLYVIPYGRIQKIISEHCLPAYRTLLFRRYMIEFSTLLAKKIGAKGLLTGDSLGQVSSQTLSNMALLDKSTTLPIFRPLIGFNKIEIINLSKKIGTHDISILPHDDACSLFAVRHPVTNPHRGQWEAFANSVSLTEELALCLEKMEVYSFSSEKKGARISSPSPAPT